MEEILKHKSAVYTEEVIFDGQAEQGVELDYVLPDYYPDIFKILKCILSPKIISYSAAGEGKLCLDGIVYIRVLYLAENSGAVHCIEQRSSYSKIIDIGKKRIGVGNQTIKITPRTDYCNCRAVSPRRLDVRGAVSAKIRISSVSEFALPDIPNGLQVRTGDIECLGETLCAEKQFSVREEIETGASGIGFIVSIDYLPKITDMRVIADKVVLKGLVTVSALYGLYNPESAGASAMEKMSADIPISQIIDLPGVTDSHNCLPEITVLNTELIPKSDSGVMSCEIIAICSVKANKSETVSIPADIYSTKYETDYETKPLKLSVFPRTAKETLNIKSSLSCDSGEIESVWDCAAEITNIMCRQNPEGGLLLAGQITTRAMGKTSGGTPYFIEKQDAFENIIPAEGISDLTAIEFAANIVSTDFNIKSDGTIEASSQLEFNGRLSEILQVEAISSVTVHEDRPKTPEGDFALRICYADGTQCVWDVAKRYNTTVDAIMSDNEITDPDAAVSGMIFIPTI